MCGVPGPPHPQPKVVWNFWGTKAHCSFDRTGFSFWLELAKRWAINLAYFSWIAYAQGMPWSERLAFSETVGNDSHRRNSICVFNLSNSPQSGHKHVVRQTQSMAVWLCVMEKQDLPVWKKDILNASILFSVVLSNAAFWHRGGKILPLPSFPLDIFQHPGRTWQCWVVTCVRALSRAAEVSQVKFLTAHWKTTGVLYTKLCALL